MNSVVIDQSFVFKGKTYYRGPLLSGPFGASRKISSKPLPSKCPTCGLPFNLIASKDAEIERLTNRCAVLNADGIAARKAAANNLARAETAERLLAEARGKALDEAAACADAWSKPSVVKLAAGEMTAQELRTAQAVARGISSAILSLKDTQPLSGEKV